MFGQKHTLSREGGVEIVVRELATRMAARGHAVVCYDRKARHVSGEAMEAQPEYRGVKIVPVWTIERKGFAALTASFSAAWRATWSDADVVHIHAEGPAAMCWLPKLRGKRVVVTVHGLDWQRAKWRGLASSYIKWGERQAARRADGIIVLSRRVQDYFRRTYGRDTVYIPNGVDRPEIREADEIKKRWGLTKDSYVLFLSRIVPEKGPQYLIEAWKGVKTDKKLVIAGGSSDTEPFLDALKRSGGEGVVFTGFQQGRVLEELYSNSYAYCLPSDLEGMPLSLLEAMSYGNCCVVSDIAECTEMVEDRAVVFRRADAEDLRRVLQALLDAPGTVRKYREGASGFVLNRYSWEAAVDATLALYGR